MKTWLCTLALILAVGAAPTRVLAQDASSNLVDQSLRDAMLVGAAGLGGAILGLSTLSFVEEPKDHLKNVLVGGALGIIVGVGVVAYTQATKSETIYRQQGASLTPVDFNTSQRLSWHRREQALVAPPLPSQVGYQFSF